MATVNKSYQNLVKVTTNKQKLPTVTKSYQKLSKVTKSHKLTKTFELKKLICLNKKKLKSSMSYQIYTINTKRKQNLAKNSKTTFIYFQRVFSLTGHKSDSMIFKQFADMSIFMIFNAFFVQYSGLYTTGFKQS